LPKYRIADIFVDMDLKQLIEDLRSAGWTQAQIADRAGCSQPTISELASGVTGKRGPSFRIAAAIVALHQEVCSGTAIRGTQKVA